MKKEYKEQLDAVMTRLKSSHPHLTEKQIRKTFLGMKKETEDCLKVKEEVKANLQRLAFLEINRVFQNLQPEDIGVRFNNEGHPYVFLNIHFGNGNESFYGDLYIAETLEMKKFKKQKVPTPKRHLVVYTDGTACIDGVKKGRK